MIANNKRTLIAIVADLDKIVSFKFSLKKIGTHPFKARASLFEQVPACCKQAAACFKLADTYFEESISWFLKFWSVKPIWTICCLKHVPTYFEMCVCLFKTGSSCFERVVYQFWTRVLLIHSGEQEGIFLKTGWRLFVNWWPSIW